MTKTEIHICDGCGKREKLGQLPKSARNHYCDCNPSAPFYMTPLRIKKASLRAMQESNLIGTR